MGIGNFRLPSSGLLAQAYKLITPHGDREHCHLIRLPDVSSPGSLPLMGIGNDPSRSSTVPAHELITPHGDRELDARPTRHALDAKSFLITPHGDRERPSRMRVRSGQCNQLITPHGDREHDAGPAWPWRRPRLITPHGDREPGSLGVSSSAHIGHHLITPHGDRERSTSGTMRSLRYCDSLPLMGIGNPWGNG